MPLDRDCPDRNRARWAARAPVAAQIWSAKADDEGLRRVVVVAVSLTLHLALGLLAALVTHASPRTDEAAASVEVVFETPLGPVHPPAAETARVPAPDTALDVAPELAKVPAAAEPVGLPPLPDQVAAPPPDQPSLPSPALGLEAQAMPALVPSELVPEVKPVPQSLPDTQPGLSEPPAAAYSPKPARAVRPSTRPAPREVAPAPSLSNTRQALNASPPTAAVQAQPSSAPTASVWARPASPPAPMSATIDEAWRGSVAAWTRSRQRYPEAARRLGQEGAATVRFTVARDGQVLEVQLAHVSGSDLLDQAAVAMFRGARAPPFPADMVQQQVTVAIAIRYRLQE